MKQILYQPEKNPRILRSVVYMCLIGFPLCLQGEELTEQQVQTAVETWVRHVTADARPDAVIVEMEPYLVDGRTAAYIAHLAEGGFCLCGNDDLVLPVYLYCPQDRYDPENPNFQYVLWEIYARTEALTQAVRERSLIIQEHEPELASRSLSWQELAAGRVPERVFSGEEAMAAPSMMELAFTPVWGQGSPYNDQCPELPPGSGIHTIVGCTATMTSQLMYYWQWPHAGVGSHSVAYHWRWRNIWDEEPLATNPNIPANWGGGGRLEWTAASGGRLRMNGDWDISVYNSARQISSDAAYLSALEILWNRLNQTITTCNANFGATTYDWSVMQDSHTDPPDDGDADVAELCYQVAVSIDTSFGIWASGSDNWRVPDPIVNFFQYDPDISYGPPVTSQMQEEIQWLRPLGFSGSGPPGGHAWVVFGYNTSTSQYKMNMGWPGQGNNIGWYALDNIPLDLNANHRQLIRIAPSNVVQFVGNTGSGDGSPDNPYEGIEEALQNAPDAATLIFKAGSINTFTSSPLVLNRPLTLKGYNVTIIKP
jgi:hypothetical protein